MLYLDTAALVKLYAEEEARDTVLQARDDADLVLSATIAYVEARSAFAQKRRLAAAESVQAILQESVQFACFDRAMSDAARSLEPRPIPHVV